MPAPAVGQVRGGGFQVRGVWSRRSRGRRLPGELAGGPSGQRQASAGAGKHDLGPLFLGELRDCESQGCVGQDAGDEDALAVEDAHAAGPYPNAPERSKMHMSDPRCHRVSDDCRDHRGNGSARAWAWASPRRGRDTGPDRLERRRTGDRGRGRATWIPGSDRGLDMTGVENAEAAACDSSWSRPLGRRSCRP